MKKPYDVFKAIADPTRREIIRILVLASAALSINAVANHFSTSRQAVTKHLKILQRAGLVEIEENGRDRYCYATPEHLRTVYDWVSRYEKFWDRKLVSLEHYLKKKS